MFVRGLSLLSVSWGATTAQALNQQRKAYCLGSRDMAERLLGHVEQQQHAGAGQQINVAVLKALLRREMEDLEGNYAAHVAAAAAVPPLAPASTEVRALPTLAYNTPSLVLRESRPFASTTRTRVRGHAWRQFAATQLLPLSLHLSVSAHRSPAHSPQTQIYQRP